MFSKRFFLSFLRISFLKSHFPLKKHLTTPRIFNFSAKKFSTNQISEEDFQSKLVEFENQIYLFWSDENYQECLNLRLQEMQLKKSYYNTEAYSVFSEDCCKIGVLYNEIMDDKNALEFFDKGLQNLLNEPNNYAIIADIKHNKGITQMNIGKLGEAIVLVEEAKALKQQIYKPEEDYISLGITCFNLGNMYELNGEMIEKAIGNYLEAIELFKSGMEDNPKECLLNLANTYEQLGLLYFTIKQFEKAKEIFEQTPKMFEESFGKEHILVVKSLCNAATTFLALKEYETAEENLLKALDLIEIPNEITWSLYCLVNMLLARMEFQTGNSENSKRLLQNVEEMFEELKIEDLNQLHSFYLEKSQILIGLEEYEAAFASIKKCMDFNHKLFENGKKNLALPNIFIVYAKYFLYHKKESQKAGQFIEQAYVKALEYYGEFDEIIGQLHKLKATICYHEKKLKESVELLKKAEIIFEKNRKTSLFELAEVTFDIGMLYKEIEYKEEGLNYLMKSLDLQKELYYI